MASVQERGGPASRREAIEARILQATEGLLRDGASFGELSVERIATESAISRPAFYFYFRDKRDLLMRLTAHVAESLYAQADAWWSGPADGRAELEAALGEVVALYREHGPLLRAVVEASAYDEQVAGFWRELVGRFIDATRRRILDEQATGRIAALPAEETAFALCWMTERSCYQLVVRGGDLGDPHFARALTRVWVATLYSPTT